MVPELLFCRYAVKITVVCLYGPLTTLSLKWKCLFSNWELILMKTERPMWPVINCKFAAKAMFCSLKTLIWSLVKVYTLYNLMIGLKGFLKGCGERG